MNMYIHKKHSDRERKIGIQGIRNSHVPMFKYQDKSERVDSGDMPSGFVWSGWPGNWANHYD